MQIVVTKRIAFQWFFFGLGLASICVVVVFPMPLLCWLLAVFTVLSLAYERHCVRCVFLHCIIASDTVLVMHSYGHSGKAWPLTLPHSTLPHSGTFTAHPANHDTPTLTQQGIATQDTEEIGIHVREIEIGIQNAVESDESDRERWPKGGSWFRKIRLDLRW